MKHRFLTVAGTLAVVALSMPTAAVAAGAGSVSAPASGSAVSAPVDVVVQVNGQTGLGQGDHSVRVRLANLNQQPVDGTAIRELDCQSGPCNGDSTWGGVTFNPATLEPFLSTSNRCNGGYLIQLSVDGGSWTNNSLHVALPPAAPTAVTVTPGEETAQVDWAKAAGPDVTGYRVERRASGGSWSLVAEVAPTTKSAVDEAAPAGSVEYRVTTQRADGLVNGSPATPCTDSGRDLQTSSAPVTTTIEATPEPTEEPTTEPTGEPTEQPAPPSRPNPTPTSQPTSGEGGTDGGEQTGVEGSEVTASEGATESPSEGQTSAGSTTYVPPSGGSRQAPRTSVGTASRPELNIPGALVASEPEERYYGEDDEFAGELNFGNLAGDEEELGTVTTSTEIQVPVPGALQAVFGEKIDLKKLVQPLAGGLLLLSFGAHLRRWIYAAELD